MRYKATLLVGFAVGFVAGARAGRERYDQLVNLGRKAADNPAVQNATKAATAKATDLTKSAAAKAPDLAKAAAPKVAAAAKQAASRLPFTGRGDEPAEGPDASVPYQAEDSPASYNGVRAD